MEEVAAVQLFGTENAQDPFWSPDSRWIAFLAEGKVKKIAASGGPVQLVAEGLADTRGASWGIDDTILFAYGNSVIHRVAAAGGPDTRLTTLDASNQEGSHRFPQFLPDGRHFLFLIRGQSDRRGIYVGSVDGKTKKFLVRSDSSAVFAPPGHLLFLAGDSLLGQEFDTGHLELRGQPFVVAERVGRSSLGYCSVAASRSGALAYSGALLRVTRLIWFDRNGKQLDTVGQEGDYIDFRLSPDEQRVATSLADPKSAGSDVWLTDLARRSMSRLTFGPLINASAIWSPDGSQIVFRTTRRGLVEFYQKSAAGGGQEEPLLLEAAQRAARMQSINNVATDWSPDGRHILLTATQLSGFDLWVLPMNDRKPTRLIASTSDEMHGNFSPDGKLVAYSSNESGRFEVHVQTFPLSDRKWQVSTTGGYEPRWRRDGREIYYLSEDRKLMAVNVGPGPKFDVPKPLFQTGVPPGVNALRTNYVPAGDGRRFLINTQTAEPAPNPITVVLNWTAGLKK
jgi:eukaryotic-like serine/threonine-protein kinase